MKKVVIFLHGVGSNGANLAELGKYWSTTLGDVLFLSPNAPERFHNGMEGAYQWFSIDGVTAANRAERVINARPAFEQTLRQLYSTHDIDPSRDKIILVGFSQGSIMALDTLLHGKFPLAGVIAFSGRIATDPERTINNSVPVLLVHGMKDTAIPYQESQKSEAILLTSGFNVKTLYEPDNIHTISNAGALRALQFITEIFGDA